MQPPWVSVASHGNNFSMSPHWNPNLEFYIGSEMGEKLQKALTTPESNKALGEEAYEWYTPDDDRMTSITFRGNRARLRNAMDKVLTQGRKTTITFVGGSITGGVGKNEGLAYPDWFSVVLRKFLKGVPASALSVKTVALYATTSALMDSCHRLYLPQDTDIFFLEYTINDADSAHSGSKTNTPLRRAMERLVRKLLGYPNNPAVIFLHAFWWKTGWSHKASLASSAAAFSAIRYTESHISAAAAKKHHTQVVAPSLDPYGESTWQNYTSFGGYAEESAERSFMELAWFYGLPSVSVKAAVYNLMQIGVDGFHIFSPTKQQNVTGREDPRLVTHAFFADKVHPEGNTGHRVMGELAAQILLDTAASLGSNPLNSLGTDDDIQPVHPEPMIIRNYQSKMDTCIVGDALKTAAQPGSSGFEWTDEGRGKWGWVATQPGSKLLIHLGMVADGEQADHSTEVGINIGYLKSFEHIGMAQVGINIGHLRSFEHIGMAQVGINIGYLRSFEHMGMAQVECISGCRCTTSILDGNTKERTSLLRLHNIRVAQTTACTLVITILEESNALNREHKFKVGGVMVSEDMEVSKVPMFGKCVPGGHGSGCDNMAMSGGDNA
eukprot:gene27312-4616_t